MQLTSISPISSASPTSYVNRVSTNFSGRRDNVDAFIGLDDDSIRQLAYLKTQSKVDHERNNKITNTLFYNAPLAAGLGTALLSKSGTTKLFNKQLTGTAGRMAKGLKVAALWTAGLLALDGLGALKNKLSENSSTVRKFDKEHPILSIGATLAAGFGVLALLTKGAGRLGKMKAPKFLQKMATGFGKFANQSKLMVSAKNGFMKLSKNTPPVLKEIGAGALDIAPTALLFGGLFHSIGSANAESREFAKNYTELRDKQAHLSQTRVRELSLQNDFLMQDSQNKEDVELLQDNFAGLPEEVLEKVESLRADNAVEV